ncbi:hypothetical protein ACCUM_3304 [Candidatus Accumulibacter phosphatis]|uniref:Uncharacterized protein n=1 Tax=Candidatus Accumulibacter phosphatis TaxID=327160 RepID=A0A5S4EP95_9PROT|nr:hypothetical protein ACCUM_3304 [Candidatus Accumulibacter phosphatis]
MFAAKRAAGVRDGSHFEYEFPQHSLLFDDERILRNLT